MKEFNSATVRLTPGGGCEAISYNLLFARPSFWACDAHVLVLVALSQISELKNGMQKEDSFNTREESGADQLRFKTPWNWCESSC